MTQAPGRFARILCSAVLSFEAVVMLLSILVLNGFSALPPAGAAGVGGGLAAMCVLAAGLLGRPWGYGFGHVLQVVIVAAGFLAPTVLFIGLVFAALWVVAYVIGLRIDLDRAVR